MPQVRIFSIENHSISVKHELLGTFLQDIFVNENHPARLKNNSELFITVLGAKGSYKIVMKYDVKK